jgi:hypothetical protein
MRVAPLEIEDWSKKEHPVKRLDSKSRDDMQFLTLTHYRLLSHSKAFRNNFLKQVIIGCI